MVEADAPFESGMAQARPNALFPAPQTNDSDMISGRNVAAGFEFQFMLTWNGVASISRFDIMAEASKAGPDIEGGTNTKLLTGVPPDDFTYDMENAS